jgi:hypothetical protein
MFGHDDQNQYNDTSTPVVNPNDDSGAAPAPDNATSAPAFDTSSISLPGSDPVTTTPDPTLAEHHEEPAVSAPDPVQDDHLLTPTGTADDLLSIKQNALQQLSPLVGHLEQTPEEKFRTTMMMIQASDDQSLIQAAYDAAQAITDDKVKAQALLDIINEINYFTQQSQDQA